MPTHRSLCCAAFAASALIPVASALAVPITPADVAYDESAFAVDLNGRNDALVALTRGDGTVEVVRRRGANGAFRAPVAVGKGRVVAARLGARRGQALVLYVRGTRIREAALTRRGWVERTIPRTLTKGERLLSLGYSGQRFVAVVRSEGAPTLRVLVRARSGAWSLAATRDLPTGHRVIAAVSEGSGGVVAAWKAAGGNAQVNAAVWPFGATGFRPAVSVFDQAATSFGVRPLDLAITARGESAVVGRLAGGGLAAYGYGNTYRQILRLGRAGKLRGRSEAVPTEALSLTRTGTVLGVATNADEAPYDPARDIIRVTRYSSGRILRPATPLTVLSAERDDVTLLDQVNGIETTSNGLSVVWWDNDAGPGPNDVRYSFLRPGASRFALPVRTAGQSRGRSLVGVGSSRALLVFVDDSSGSGRVRATPIG